MADGSPRERIKCKLLFKLSRRHGWGAPISKDGLVDQALADSEAQLGRDVCEHLKNEPYISYQRGRGYSIKNNPDAQAQIAFFLRDTCSYSEIRIEATLSRFEQSGGFDTYDSPP